MHLAMPLAQSSREISAGVAALQGILNHPPRYSYVYLPNAAPLHTLGATDTSLRVSFFCKYTSKRLSFATPVSSFLRASRPPRGILHKAVECLCSRGSSYRQA